MGKHSHDNAGYQISLAEIADCLKMAASVIEDMQGADIFHDVSSAHKLSHQDDYIDDAASSRFRIGFY